MREHNLDGYSYSARDKTRGRRGRPRGDAEDSPYQPLRRRTAAAIDTTGDNDPPDVGDRWSTWDTGLRGPEPYPDWLVTELAAIDVDLGVLKTGKEADVHLVRRAVPGTDRSCLLAAKRYRDAEHRLFHRDAGYLEGRRVRRSRENRAMGNRTDFGRQMIAGQWAAAEFEALSRLWQLNAEYGGLTVPYPVQLIGTEVLLEFVGDAEAGQAAPRLAQLRPTGRQLADLWQQLVEGLLLVARAGFAHGDLSPYNLLVADQRLIMIDLPQVVDVVANPQGPEFLARDVLVMTRWFTARGLLGLDPDQLTESLLAEAGLRR